MVEGNLKEALVDSSQHNYIPSIFSSRIFLIVSNAAGFSKSIGDFAISLISLIMSSLKNALSFPFLRADAIKSPAKEMSEASRCLISSPSTKGVDVVPFKIFFQIDL